MRKGGCRMDDRGQGVFLALMSAALVGNLGFLAMNFSHSLSKEIEQNTALDTAKRIQTLLMKLVQYKASWCKTIYTASPTDSVACLQLPTNDCNAYYGSA